MPTRLARGNRVGDRYRLESELGRGADGSTWEAVDERLDRRVALRFFDSGLDRKTIVKRAGMAASLTHPRVVRVFDTGQDAGRFFTVSELLQESLTSVRVPVDPETALQIAIDVAEALYYAHDRGVVHGNLHEANVLLSEGGAKVGDFALSPASDNTDRDDDLREFGALMRRVTRMPDPAAPVGFSRVVEGLASGAYTSAGEALTELRALRPQPAVVAAAPARRIGWIVVVAAALLAVAGIGLTRLGERSPGQRLVPGGRIEGEPLKIVGAADFDPFGRPAPARENPETVRNVFDGRAETFWTTESYKAGPNFSGLKDGVGVILDLGETTEVGRSQVLFALHGCSFELRHSEDKSLPLGEWETAAQVNESPISAALEFDTVGSRYWMLWITQLVAGSPGTSGYGCAVKEIELFAP
jgi:serine/threonine protein kinase